MLLNFTAVAPVRPEPRMVTVAPALALVGEKLAMPGRILKSIVLFAVPAGVVIAILPVIAPTGTVALMDVAELSVIVAATPPN